MEYDSHGAVLCQFKMLYPLILHLKSVPNALSFITCYEISQQQGGRIFPQWFGKKKSSNAVSKRDIKYHRRSKKKSAPSYNPLAYLKSINVASMVDKDRINNSLRRGAVKAHGVTYVKPAVMQEEPIEEDPVLDENIEDGEPENQEALNVPEVEIEDEQNDEANEGTSNNPPVVANEGTSNNPPVVANEGTSNNLPTDANEETLVVANEGALNNPPVTATDAKEETFVDAGEHVNEDNLIDAEEHINDDLIDAEDHNNDDLIDAEEYDDEGMQIYPQEEDDDIDDQDGDLTEPPTKTQFFESIPIAHFETAPERANVVAMKKPPRSNLWDIFLMEPDSIEEEEVDEQKPSKIRFGDYKLTNYPQYYE